MSGQRCSCLCNNVALVPAAQEGHQNNPFLEPAVSGAASGASPGNPSSAPLSDYGQNTDYESAPRSPSFPPTLAASAPTTSCRHLFTCKHSYGHMESHCFHADNTDDTRWDSEDPNYHALQKHRLQFFQSLDSLRHSGALCDVTIVCDGTEIAAHKVVLASCCPYFQTMFLGSFPESRAEKVELQGIEPVALETLINFMYTSKIHLCRDNVEVILSAANLLQMDVVKDLSCQLLQAQLSPANCLQIWHIADLYSCYQLRQDVESYTQEHFTEVIKGPDFLALSKERIEKIISSDILSVNSEEKVYEALMSWTRHDSEHRLQHLSELLQNIRLVLLPMKYLVLQVKEEPLISSSLDCSKLVMDAMSYLMLKDNPAGRNRQEINYEIASPAVAEMKPRVPAGVEQVMLVFGGEDEAALSTLECYSFREKNWQPAQAMPIFLSKAGCIVHGGKIYLIGGHNGARHLRTVICYDPRTDVYSYVASMHYVRSEVGTGALDDKLFAIGGHDGTSYLRTAECYDSTADRWKMIAPMPGGGKSAVGVGTANGLVYVVGGIDRDALVGTMECYNPKTDCWTVVPGVKCPKKYVGVAELGGLLYLAGGRYSDDSSSLKVHCFDPKSNKLKQVKDMPCTFPSPSLLSHNGTLYVDGRIKFLSYNPQNDTWTELRGKSVYRHHSMAAIVDRPMRN